MLMLNGNTIVNSVPHAIRIRLKSGKFITIPPSKEFQIRLGSKYKVLSCEEGIEFAEMSFYDRANVFKSFSIDYENKKILFMNYEFEANTVIICSKLVALYAKELGLPKGIFAVPEGIKFEKSRHKYCKRLAFLK